MRPTHLLVLAAAVALLLPAAAHAGRAQFTLVEAPSELLHGDPGPALDEIADLGADGIRIQLAWRSVAPQPGARRAPSFDAADPAAYDGWGRYDAAVDGARARGLRVHLTITGPAPRWATPRGRDGDGLTRPDPAAFGRFATAVGRRYGSRVALWSIWNEPNLGKLLRPIFRGRTRTLASPLAYRELYLRGYAGLRGAGVRRPILLGELAPQGNRQRVNGTVAPLAFLRAMLCLDRRYRPVRVQRRRCARVPAQGVAMHPYSTQAGPFLKPRIDRDNVTIGVLGRLSRALDRAARAGAIARGLPIYITEFGVQSFPDRRIGVPLAVQSDYRSISERIAYLNRRVRSFSQYLLRDDPDIAAGRFGAFQSGLHLRSGRPKPARAGFRLPLVVVPTRGRAGRARLWGLVRPARAARRAGVVTIEYRDRGRWRRLGTQRFGRDGAWGRAVRTRPGRLWRVRWTAPDGARHVGSATRAWTRPWTRGR